tara:strand:+ start:32 stop:322 length:291 start_codon:yes stop_codon:yes gene_type:complete
MTPVVLNSFELSDIQKIVEDVFEKKIQDFKPKEKKALTLLTRKETAKLLCISLPTLHDWTKTGIIKAHRIGNRVLYKLEEVNDSLSEIKTNQSRTV